MGRKPRSADHQGELGNNMHAKYEGWQDLRKFNYALLENGVGTCFTVKVNCGQF